MEGKPALLSPKTIAEGGGSRRIEAAARLRATIYPFRADQVAVSNAVLEQDHTR